MDCGIDDARAVEQQATLAVVPIWTRATLILHILGMNDLDIGPEYYAESDEDGHFQNGQLFHIARNSEGGAITTGVGRFHIWRKKLSPEGFFPHSRLDCYVLDHHLAPDPAWLARALLTALMQQGVVSEPVWLEWHRFSNSDGEAWGEVFDYD